MARIHFTSQSHRLISGSSLPSTRTGYGTADIGASFRVEALSSRTRRVLEHDDAARERRRFEQLKRRLASHEQVLAAPDHDRRHREVELVQETMLEQCLVELAGAELEDVAAGF